MIEAEKTQANVCLSIFASGVLESLKESETRAKAAIGNRMTLPVMVGSTPLGIDWLTISKLRSVNTVATPHAKDERRPRPRANKLTSCLLDDWEETFPFEISITPIEIKMAEAINDFGTVSSLTIKATRNVKNGKVVDRAMESVVPIFS